MAMGLTAAAIQTMADKGLSAQDIADIARANEKRADPTATERKRRQRAKAASRRDVTRDPPNDIDILTPREVSEAKASSPQPWALPIGVSLQVWTDFLTNRKRKRLPNTPTAWKSFNDDLSRVAIETGIPPPKLIELCTAKGWGAIYDPRSSKNERPANSNHPGLGKTSAAIAGLGNWDDDRPM
jgi:hypothetical protein